MCNINDSNTEEAQLLEIYIRQFFKYSSWYKGNSHDSSLGISVRHFYITEISESSMTTELHLARICLKQDL